MRIIDADALRDYALECNRESPKWTGSRVVTMIAHAPTIDAVPVVHGRWIFDQHRWICSKCRENPTFGMGYVQSEGNLYNFCPNCGAKMDEENE